MYLPLKLIVFRLVMVLCIAEFYGNWPTLLEWSICILNVDMNSYNRSVLSPDKIGNYANDSAIRSIDYEFKKGPSDLNGVKYKNNEFKFTHLSKNSDNFPTILFDTLGFANFMDILIIHTNTW